MQRNHFIHKLTIALMSKGGDNYSIQSATKMAEEAADALERKKIYFDQQASIFDTDRLP